MASEWRMVEDGCTQIDLWIATPKEGTEEHVAMMVALGEYVDNVGLCVTATRTFFRYTGGTELGMRIGIRNYPRFPSEWPDLIGHAVELGKTMAKVGDQQTFMIEDGETVFWFTRNPEHHQEPHEWC